MPEPVPPPTPPPLPGPSESGSDGDASGRPVITTVPDASGFASRSTCGGGGALCCGEDRTSTRLVTGTVSRSCPIAFAREGDCSCLLPPPPPPPPGSGRSRKTSRGNCIGSAAVSGARAVDRDQAAEITIEITAVWKITEAMPARLPDRARCGSRGAGSTRHNSERPDGEASASVESTGLIRPAGGIVAYSINPNRLAVTLRR